MRIVTRTVLRLLAMSVVSVGTTLAQVSEAWVARYNGPRDSTDQAFSLAVDRSGNVYVAGGSIHSGENFDFVTIKYSSAGVQQWIAPYNGPADSTDVARAITVDTIGNVYVTGYSYGSGTDFDYLTIKYNASGVQQWAARYNGPADSSDFATSVAVDGSGNVLVTGRSIGTGSDYDYATIKYNSSGVQQRVQRYDGPGNRYDAANAIKASPSGIVYVTGESYASESDRDYATIRYNASLDVVWIARYDGPAHGDDAAYALGVDRNGNAYVTGASSGNYSDYATIKYNQGGDTAWVRTYNGWGNWNDYAYSIAVDDSGNVYVTGGANESGFAWDSDYTTIRYSAAGLQQWVAHYNNWYIDVATSLILDGSRNVYVTGLSLDGGFDYATVKYNSAGVEQWRARYSGTGGGDDIAYSIGVDDTGNVYVTGQSWGSGTDYDFATLKLRSDPPITVTSPNGGENWSVGEVHDITWTSFNINDVRIQYTTNGGGNWLTITESTPAGSGSYSWTIPNTPSTQCKVRISDTDNASVNDVSDNTFTIGVAASIAVTSPNGGENWLVGGSHNVTWTSTGVTDVRIEYTTNNGTSWSTIIASTPASAGSYAWTVPYAPSTECRVRISDVANPSVSDTSDGPFGITSTDRIVRDGDILFSGHSYGLTCNIVPGATSYKFVLYFSDSTSTKTPFAFQGDSLVLSSSTNYKQLSGVMLDINLVPAKYYWRAYDNNWNALTPKNVFLRVNLIAPSNISNQPVILVHGWRSDGSMWRGSGSWNVRFP